MDSKRTVLAIGAHADDVEFQMAGTLSLLVKSGFEPHIMTIAKCDLDSNEMSREEMVKIRDQEARRSAAVIGAVYHPAIVPDMMIFYGDRLLRKVAAVVREVKAEHDNANEPYGTLWKKSYTSLAKLYDMNVVGVSNVGRINAGVWKGRKCIGCSLAVGPGGQVLAQGPYGENAECLMTVSLEPLPCPARGTDIAEMLKSKGCEGP